MFILDELNKILTNLSKLLDDQGNEANKIKLSLPDIKPVKVDKQYLISKVTYKYDKNFHSSMLDHRYSLSFHDKLVTLKEALINEKCPTTDALFLGLMYTTVLTRLMQTTPYQYPTAKLIVCDSSSYDFLCRLKALTVFKDIYNELGVRIDIKNLLHKDPFDISAIVLLQNLVDMFDSVDESIIVKAKHVLTGETIYNFNYDLLKRIFPYIKMTNLFIMVDNWSGKFDLNQFDLKRSKKDETILQFFRRFARNTSLIDISNLVKLIGIPHRIYDNSLMLSASHAMEYKSISSEITFNKIDFTSLTYLAERFLFISKYLKLRLHTISYQKDEFTLGQTKVFSQFIKSSLNAQAANTSGEDKDVKGLARVIVIDRFYCVESAFQHADKYGAFFEQERSQLESCQRFKLDSIDKLDAILQLTPLTETLNTILKHSTRLRSVPVSSPIVGQSYRSNYRPTNQNQALATSLSIKRHLNSTKTVYRCLNEGYLLMLKIETSLDTINNQLSDRNEGLELKEQTLIVNSLMRVSEAFKQLVNQTSGGSMSGSDLIRVVLIMIDTINKLSSLINRCGHKSDKSVKLLMDTKRSVSNDIDLKKAINSSTEIGSKKMEKDLKKIYSNFDRLSGEVCRERVHKSLYQTVREFSLNKKLDQESFITIKLQDEEAVSSEKMDVIILMFLGAMTYHELSCIKYIEKKLLKTSGRIVVLYGSLVKPEIFLESLETDQNV